MKKPALIASTAGVTSAVWAVAASVLFMSGTVVPSAQTDAAAAPAPTATATEQVTTPPPATTEPAATPEPSDGGEPSESTDPLASPTPTEEMPELIDVTLTPESGTLYLHAVQAFSPELESWVVDHEAGELVYHRYNCLGQTTAAGSGVLEQQGDDRWQVTWDGSSPMRLSSGQTERFTITDRTLTYGTEVSTSKADIELDNFVGECGDIVALFTL